MSDKEITREAMHKLLKEDPGHDWLQYLKEEEFAKDEKGHQHPKVMGLRRLANIRGIKNMDVNGGMSTIATKQLGTVPLAYVNVRIEFSDGEVTADGADCHKGNCSLYGHHPYATAVSRAVGRAIARAFNIERVSEEMDPLTSDDTYGDPKQPASDVQKSILKSMSKSRKIDLQKKIDVLFPDQEKNVDSLKSGDVSRLIRFINDGKG